MIPVILASQSPRRKQLLEWAEIPFEVQVSDTEETFPEELSFEEAAIYIAREKAKVISEKYPTDKPIIAADTMVICNGEHLSKPIDTEDAFRMLSMLSGNTHHVVTGVVILYKEKEMAFSDTTEVTFNELSADQIRFYVEKYKPFDKAGAYAIQEWIGVVGIQKIEGDFYNVMGLPINRVVKLLSTLG